MKLLKDLISKFKIFFQGKFFGIPKSLIFILGTVVFLTFVPSLLTVTRNFTKLDTVISKPGDNVNSIDIGGVQRSYILHIPKESEDKQSSLIIALHGATSNASGLEQAIAPIFYPVTDKENIIIAYLNGVGDQGFGTNGESWNAGICCGFPQVHHIDDIGFITSLIQELQLALNINPHKIYILGASNGSMLAYNIECQGKLNIAGYILFSATTNSSCKPSYLSSMLFVHGMKDTIIPYNGGNVNVPKIIGLSNDPRTVYFPSTTSVVNNWAKINRCKITSTSFENVSPLALSIEEHNNCLNNTEIALISMPEGNHLSPIDQNMMAVINDFLNKR